jgi:hypothetical protein
MRLPILEAEKIAGVLISRGLLIILEIDQDQVRPFLGKAPGKLETFRRMRLEPAARDIFEHRPALRTGLGVIGVNPEFVASGTIPREVPDDEKALLTSSRLNGLNVLK